MDTYIESHFAGALSYRSVKPPSLIRSRVSECVSAAAFPTYCVWIHHISWPTPLVRSGSIQRDALSQGWGRNTMLMVPPGWWNENYRIVALTSHTSTNKLTNCCFILHVPFFYFYYYYSHVHILHPPISSHILVFVSFAPAASADKKTFS